MTLFYYRGKNQSGEEISGIYEADDDYIVAKIVKARGFTPVTIKRYKSGIISPLLTRFSKGNSKNLVVFCRQLSVLLKTGVPIMESLDIINEQLENSNFRKSIESVGYQVGQGFTLAEACRQHPEVFPEVFVNTIEAGESSGKLGEVLHKLAAYYEELIQKREKAKNALTYPIILGVVVFVVFSFLITTVLPTLADMYVTSMLPFPTKILLYIGKNYFKVLGLAFVFILGIAGIYIMIYNSERVLFLYSKKLLSIPVYGELQRKIITTRLCRILSLLMENGVPIIKALELASKTIENAFIKNELRKITSGLKDGGTLGQLLNPKFFPPIMIKLVSVGEETQTLEEMLNNTAAFYESEVDLLVERIINLVEPMIIVFMSIIIGFIVVGVLMPMMDIYNHY